MGGENRRKTERGERIKANANRKGKSRKKCQLKKQAYQEEQCNDDGHRKASDAPGKSPALGRRGGGGMTTRQGKRLGRGRTRWPKEKKRGGLGGGGWGGENRGGKKK